MEGFFHILTFFFLFTMLWCGWIGVQTFKIIKTSQDLRSASRFSDKLILGVCVIVGLTCFSILFIYPGILYEKPSVTAILEVGLAFVLLYLHDLQTKNWKRFKRSLLSS